MNKIDSLQVFYGVVSAQNKVVIIRKFVENDNPLCYLQLNCNTLETSVLRSTDIEYSEENFRSAIMGTRYETLIGKSYKKRNIELGGISEVKKGFALTVDLCPSTKPLDFAFFYQLIKNNISPIYLCVSGMWINRHKKEFEFLKSLKPIQIFWVNHSYFHSFEQGSHHRNFMLINNTDLNFEILATETVFLENGIIPSIFFRFPGLRTDRDLSKRVVDYGLIALGSNSWLAKGQKLLSGSIVLVHANGNEPEGLVAFDDHFKKSSLNSTHI